MMILTGKTVMSALRPPYPYGGEFIGQFLFALRLCWFPLLISTVAISYGAPGLQAGNFLVLFGALDRLGGFFVLTSIREFGPSVTSIILAGVAGTAITADLGARKIREELDALQVLGVDPVKNLVVPRFLALMVATGLFNIYAILFGILGGIIATLTFDAPLGPFFATLLTNASTTDLWGSVVKCTMYGAIIAIVSCYKGMTASGGAEGVGRAVNQGVVITFLGDLRVQLRLHPDPPRHPPRDLGDQVRVLALTALLLAGSAIAVAQEDSPYQTSSYTLDQKRTVRPTNEHFQFDYVNPEDPEAKPPAVQKVVTILPKGARYDASVPGSCAAGDEELMVQGAAACPEDSRIGGGVITVDTGVPGPGRIVTADTEFFNNAEDPEGEFIYLNTVRGTAPAPSSGPT